MEERVCVIIYTNGAYIESCLVKFNVKSCLFCHWPVDRRSTGFWFSVDRRSTETLDRSTSRSTDR